MLVFRAGTHKMLARIAYREDPDRTASSNSSLDAILGIYKIVKIIFFRSFLFHTSLFLDRFLHNLQQTSLIDCLLMLIYYLVTFPFN